MTTQQEYNLAGKSKVACQEMLQAFVSLNTVMKFKQTKNAGPIGNINER